MKKNEEDVVTIDVLELLAVLWSKIVYILLTGVIIAVCVYFFTKLMIPNIYTTSVSMYVSNNTYNTSISDSLNISDVNASQQLVDTYRIILQDDVVMDSISQKLSEAYTMEELSQFIPYELNDNDELMPSGQAIKNCISISSVDETEIMQISVTTQSPKLSADICTYLVEIAPETLIRVVGAGSVEPVGKVKIAKTPSGPNVGKYTSIGFVLGILLSAALVVLIHFFDNTVTNSEALKARFDLPVLGEIPFYDVNGGGENEK